MKRAEIYESIEEAVNLPRGTIKGDELLTSIEGWDSLSGSEFRLIVSDRWQLSLTGPAVERCETVTDLVALLGPAVED